MAEVYRDTHTRTRETVPDTADNRSLLTFANLVYLIAGIIDALLAFRFVLMLLGANAANGFTNFIYTVTRPLVAPFLGIFNSTARFGISRFEFETLIAIVVYAFIAWIIVSLLTI